MSFALIILELAYLIIRQKKKQKNSLHLQGVMSVRKQTV